MSSSPMGMIVSIMCAEDDLQRFSRRLASMVNPSPMHLTQVIATGSQVYPFNQRSVRGTAALLQCEFRMRNSGTSITEDDARKLLDRISSCQVLDSYLVDDLGVKVCAINPMSIAS